MFVVLDEKVKDWDTGLRCLAGAGITHVIIQSAKFDDDRAKQLGFGARNEAGRIGCCRWSRDRFAAPAYAYETAVRSALSGTTTRGRSRGRRVRKWS